MVEKLVSALEKYSDAYYNTTDPLIGDDTYDALVATLRIMDPDNPYLQNVGAPARKGSNKVGRLVPMGTLSKYHDNKSVEEWFASQADSIIIAPKYDGFGVELVYDNGVLVMASTRGDGYVGENVLESMTKVVGVPHQLPSKFSALKVVRGEAIVPRKYHDELRSLGYVAMRNAVPGIVRSGREDALKYVEFVAYEFFDGQDNRVTQREIYTESFIVEDFTYSDSFDYIQRVRDEMGKHKEDQPYEIDGVVLKTVSIRNDNLLNPKHQIAWKFKSNRETTILRSIEYQLGLTGKFTPIGIFDAVEFQGAKLTRASLGNMTRLATEFEDLTLDSYISVSRRGDIIPYIEDLLFINDEGEKVLPLVTCPHCNTELFYKEKEPSCDNKSCPEKLRLQISHFARSIGIKGIGDKLIRSLIDAGYVTRLTDVLKLDPQCIKQLPRQGDSAVGKWTQLQDKKLTALELLCAYPFLDLGVKVWEQLLMKFNYAYITHYLAEEELTHAKLKGIGDKKINSIIMQLVNNAEELHYLGQYYNLL